MNKWAWQTAITDNAATNIEDPSNQRFIRWERGDKAYMWVKNARNADMVLGDVVFGDTTDLNRINALYLGDANTNADQMMGVVTSAQGIKSGKYGWIQIYGVNASINTLGVAAVGATNEVQAFTFTTVPSAGSYYLQIGNKSTKILAYNDVAATVQTALDAALGTANAVVATGDGFAGANKNLILTFSGAGYAGRLITESVIVVPVVALTAGAATGPLHTVTTPGVAAVIGTAISDTMVGVSGQAYVTTGAVKAVAPPVKRYIEQLVAYATAVAALKTGFIRCLNG